MWSRTRPRKRLTVAPSKLPLVPNQSESGKLPDAYLDLLFLQWVHIIAQAELGTTQYGQSGEQWQFMRYPEGNGFSISPTIGQPRYIIETHGETSTSEAESVVQRALEAARRQDTGEAVWYRSGFTSDEPDLLGAPVQLVRNMGDKRTIEGWRRLSDLVLLEFKPSPVENPSPLNAPKTDIHVFLKVPGGGHGPFSSKVAADTLEFVRLICSFALGRPVSGFTGTGFPVDEADSKAADEQQHDFVNVPTLARNGVPLDPFAHLASLGGPRVSFATAGPWLRSTQRLSKGTRMSRRFCSCQASKRCCRPTQSGGRNALRRASLRRCWTIRPRASTPSCNTRM